MRRLLRMGIERDSIRVRNSLKICFIGPDGSGKSTVTSHLLEDMKDLFEDIRYYHNHYQILPELSRFLLKKQKNGEILINSYENKEKKQTAGLLQWLKEMIIISYYSVDYVIGGLIYIINRNKRQLIVFERSFFDYVIQPVFLSVNNLIYRFFSFLYQNLVCFFILNHQQKSKNTRKQELTLDGITCQYRIGNQLTQIMPGYSIDNNQSLEILKYKLRLAVVVTLKNRYGIE